MVQVHIKKDFEDRYKLVSKYYKLLLEVNNLHITQQQVDILAFAGVMGDISQINSRTACTRYFGISRHSLNNAISKLQREGLLIKTDRIRVVPSLRLDFTQDLIVKFELKLKDEGRDSSEGS